MTDVAVIALGKIGLPLAAAIARAGHRVRGADIDPTVVDLVNQGREPFPGEDGLAEALTELSTTGRLTATTSTFDAVTVSEVVVVVVPLIVDDEKLPDFGALDAATDAIADGIQPGTLVSYETTLPVGTTRGRFGRCLAARSGLTLGQDLFVAHSPERVFSGRIFADLSRYPKLVGAVDAASTRRAVDFYESFLTFDTRPELERPNGVWDLGSSEAAELAKLAETTYRDVNIAFANELALASEHLGVDVYSIIDACNSQPFSWIHRPGVSVGGHCIPVYPHFLLESTHGTRIPGLARQVNDLMPGHAVTQLSARLGGLLDQRVAILGLAYRPGVKEHAFSGAYALQAALVEAGASVVLHDPLYAEPELRDHGFDVYRIGDPVDVAVLHTDHREYKDLRPDDLPGIRVMYDGRAFLDPAAWPDLIQLGRPTKPQGANEYDT